MLKKCFIREPTPARAGSARNNAKKGEKVVKDGSRHRGQNSAIDALIGDEEQTGKKKKETGSGSPPQLPWTLQSPPKTRRDHAVSLFL